ncbi:MAG TPA: glycosyltransferase, partial [Chthoniobacterales bacterium]|nr:glycosyltransferase [Chthoniobacterales bacterium]
LRGKGMDFVTITDHDTIDGCLEIADLENTFISEQITTYFPHDPCKIHVLVWGMTETQRAEMLPLRENIFELQAYFAREEIAHAVAHPLYSINGKLEAIHVERLILLFKHFEGVNGLRDALLSELAQQLLNGLTPEKIDELANRHNLAPTHAEPWRKILVGGSDDHGGKFLATAWTETPRATSVGAFLEHLRAGRCEAVGEGGTPLALSHGFYNTLYYFIQDRFQERLGPGAPLVETLFSRFMEGRDPTEFSLREKANFIAQGVLSGKIFELARPGKVSLWKDLSGYFTRPEVRARIAEELEGVEEPERRTFLLANLVAERLAFRFFAEFMTQVRSGKVIEGIQALSGFVPILVMLAPYIYAFHSQAPSRKRLRELCLALTGEIPPQLQNTKRAWFTDTLEDVNGVTTTIRKMAAAAAEAGKELIVVTSRRELSVSDVPIKNFRPIGEFELPEYELQKLSFPPVLEMLDYVQRESFSEIIISTPGPVGLTGLLAGKMLNLRTAGIYHTDFPEYIRILTEDRFLESLAWRYMRWVYGQQDTVFVNSEEYRRSWIERGIEPEKLKILPRGLDTELFSPARRDPRFWERFRNGSEKIEPANSGAGPSLPNGNTNCVRLLYVGRISKEKDLEVLATAYRQLRDEGFALRVYLVGHGPYASTLAEMLPDAVFTGYLAGEDLATAYASADIFAFPSTTDTFGNVIIEAQASGLPVVVSDQGGPKELVEDGVDGFVTRGLDPEDFARGLRTLICDPGLRANMAARAREKVTKRSWPNAFRKFWAATAD